MGMYNTIKSDIPCPNCGTAVEWQSKHLSIRGYALDRLLVDITLEPDMYGEMHTFCDACQAGTDIQIHRGQPQAPVIELREEREARWERERVSRNGAR